MYCTVRVLVLSCLGVTVRLYVYLFRCSSGSCNPNCDVQAWNIAGYTRLGIYAKRDLVKGESLSYDYKASRDGGRGGPFMLFVSRKMHATLNLRCRR